MAQSFPGHPAGPAGIAMLLLRVEAASVLATLFSTYANPLHGWFAIALGFPAILLFLGLGTRVAALAATFIAVGVGIDMDNSHGAIVGLEALNFAAIVLLGPGAYSIDA